ncbi:hypothetical protein DC31_06145 [Microbacterium sp. CH12i]|uniref:hypothetical protein n=1 Tax=Microbacterium sp. CH12i TaxID=1479651 RepID=UPI00046128CB|nr:hypothetical protein DC31_06145 [Microbacterium sp. CH12i]
MGMFFFTARDQAEIETQCGGDADVEITAIGKQWAFDFMYAGEDDDLDDAVWTMGVQAQPDANGNVDTEKLPTLAPGRPEGAHQPSVP